MPPLDSYQPYEVIEHEHRARHGCIRNQQHSESDDKYRDHHQRINVEQIQHQAPLDESAIRLSVEEQTDEQAHYLSVSPMGDPVFFEPETRRPREVSWNTGVSVSFSSGVICLEDFCSRQVKQKRHGHDTFERLRRRESTKIDDGEIHCAAWPCRVLCRKSFPSVYFL
jgi:hypothetical protein